MSTQALCESAVADANFEAAHAACAVTGSRQDVTLLSYPDLLRRAIDNVLRNAIHYAPAGTEIRLNGTADDDHQQVILEVLIAVREFRTPCCRIFSGLSSAPRQHARLAAAELDWAWRL